MGAGVPCSRQMAHGRLLIVAVFTSTVWKAVFHRAMGASTSVSSFLACVGKTPRGQHHDVCGRKHRHSAVLDLLPQQYLEVRQCHHNATSSVRCIASQCTAFLQ